MTSPVTVTRCDSDAADAGAVATALSAIAPAAMPAAANPINRIVLTPALLSSSDGSRRVSPAQPLVVILAAVAPIASVAIRSAAIGGH